MKTPAVVEDLDVLEHRPTGLLPRGVRLVVDHSRLAVLEKLSATALS
jgi:hypothetical protein